MYLPEDVKLIIDRLYEHGYEAYAVGGCVRDMMLGRVPGDWDITTSAMPEQTKELFEKTFDTGIEHGTITVLLNGVGYEVTTYRIDGKYEDSRHPSEVEFTRNLREDLQRRDFTINAMAYNDREGVVDIFGGMEDLEGKIIRCVGNAEERFGEDALRILRAIRFSAQLGFEIEEETCRGIQKLASTLENISVERIQVEMVKLLVSPHPDYIDCAYQLGVTKIILPEWDELMVAQVIGCHSETENETLGQQTLRALHFVPTDKMERIATLLYQLDEAQARAILRRWKFDNETIKVVCKLISFKNSDIQADLRDVRIAIHHIGVELFPKHISVKRAELRAKLEKGETVQLEKTETVQLEKEGIQQELRKLLEIEELYRMILEKQQCVSLKQLAVTGNDLIQMGVPQGRQVGIMLQQLLELVLDEPEYNTKEILLEKAREM